MAKGWMAYGFALAVLGACGSGDQDAACEMAEPTCESILTLLLPDDRDQFRLEVRDELGADFAFECPGVDGASFALDDMTITCQQGGAVIVSNFEWGQELLVSIGFATAKQYDPSYAIGGDICGNICNSASVQLQ